MDPKDEELITLIARSALKDEQAFKSLYERVGAYLNGVALRIVKSPEASNDVLQEAFMQIWTNAGTYRPQVSKPLTWLTSIVRYRALDRLDKDQRLSKREVDADSALEEFITDSSPELDTNRIQHLQHLLACMEILSDQTKRAINLAYVYGYSRVEIAQRLQTNASTVKSWLRRGADKLRTCLQKRMVDDQ